MRQRRISVWLACLVALTPTVGWGALGIGDIVFDPTNYVENLATAIATADTLLEAIDINENTWLNIVSLNEVILTASSYTDEFAELAAEAEAVARSMQQVADNFSRLFGTESLPVTAFLYDIRRSEVYGYKYTAADHARRLQLLITSTIRLFERVIRFIDSIAVLVGGKQATLTVLQTQLEAVQALQRSEMRQAALDHLTVIDRLDEGSSIESLKRINQDAWRNWPGGEGAP
jgi:conjugal transfer/entry exclusion protein